MANYVDIEVAEPLKGVGFDEPVSKFWFKFGNSWIESDSGNIANYNSCAPLERFISKPSYDEVIHLFREKKGVCVFIEPGRFDMKGKWVPLIVDLPTTDLILAMIYQMEV